MRKYLILLTALLISTCGVVEASRQEPAFSIKRGVELFDSGRWIDARHQFVKVGEMLPSTAVTERQTIDYYLAM